MEHKIEKIFSWSLLVVFAGLFLMTWQYGARARLAPMLLLIPGIILAGVQLWRIHRRPNLIPNLIMGEGIAEEDGESFEINAPFDQEMWMMGWFVAFAAMIWLTGFLVAAPLFLILYLRLWAKESWTLVFMLAGISTLFIYLIMEVFFSIILYRGWIFSY